LNRDSPSLNDFKRFKLAKEMRRESADFIGASGKKERRAESRI
jgi:hypothetical protein